MLGIPDALLPTYLEELASTLACVGLEAAPPTATAAELVDADYQAIEAAMTEGHPAFVANNGRIGYGLDDYAAYAPETGSPVRLVWLAARREHTRLSLGAGRTEEELYAGRARPGDPRRASSSGCRDLGLDPDDYLCCRCTRGSGEQGGDHVRARPGPPRPGVPRRGSGRLPRAAVDPHLLQRQRTRSGTT